MRRPILDKGTAHVVVEVSKAPEDMSVDKMNKYVDRAIYRLRRSLQDQGKLVLRTYKTLFDMDVKVWADWVVLGEKPTRKNRMKAAQ